MTATALAKRIDLWPLDRLKPYERNARTHDGAQVAKIAASIAEFGFTNPILVDSADGIIAGHGRLMAAKMLGLAEVPVIVLDHLTDAQRRAYILADNRLALDAGWDNDMLAAELADLQGEGFDLELTGFNDEELDALLDGATNDNEAAGEADPDDGLSENYSRKIEAPVYRVTGACPGVHDLFDRTKSRALLDEIDACKALPPDVAEFLRHAAERHTVFNFRNIAEFYAHADEQTQDLMERSALVIIDFDKAIENGFVKIAKGMMEQVAGIKQDAS